MFTAQGHFSWWQLLQMARSPISGPDLTSFTPQAVCSSLNGYWPSHSVCGSSRPIVFFQLCHIAELIILFPQHYCSPPLSYTSTFTSTHHVYFFTAYLTEGPPVWSSGQSSWLQKEDVLCFLRGTNWIYLCYIEESRPPLWSSRQSSWLQIWDVLCFLWGTNWIYMLCRRK
jgi:hypothetical protein